MGLQSSPNRVADLLMHGCKVRGDVHTASQEQARADETIHSRSHGMLLCGAIVARRAVPLRDRFPLLATAWWRCVGKGRQSRGGNALKSVSTGWSSFGWVTVRVFRQTEQIHVSISSIFLPTCRGTICDSIGLLQHVGVFSMLISEC